MNGEISVNSVYKKGTTFLVTLEQDVIEQKELGKFTLESRIKTGNREAYKQSFEAPKAHILIVDDNEMNVKVAAKLLADTKLQIDTALTGMDCLKLTQNRHYDGILMDHLMPGMDGIECFHAIRTQQGGMCQETPVIALTANAGSDSQLLYKKEGFNGYLAKPVSGTLLEAAVLNILPKELVLLSQESMQAEMNKEVLMFDQRKRTSVLITTDSVCDLPLEFLRRLEISVCPYYVCTNSGRFLDGIELETDALLAYVLKDKKGSSEPPEVEDYENFFAQKLTEARNILHITMARYSSKGYEHAKEAAKAFENVTVVESGHLSSGMGLVVMYAANMARETTSVEKIVEKINDIKNRVSTSFIMNNTQMLYRGGRVSKIVHILCDSLLLHPMIVLRKSKMTVGNILVGDFSHVIKSYIRKELRDIKNIDRRILFLTYAGLDEKKLEDIQEVIQEICQFERIYLQKASSSIASNCGPGSFGLLFMRKS